MGETAQTVFVIDDDEAVRDAVCMLLTASGLDAEGYPSADAFLESFDPRREGCLVLDIRMPGLDGMQLQEKLRDIGSVLPIIFITGHGNVPMAVKAMRGGAVDFLQKPFNDGELLARVRQGLERDRELRQAAGTRAQVLQRMRSLTAREEEVLNLLVQGLSSKQIASELGVSPRTVEVHRGRVMEKMDCRSIAELTTNVLQCRQET